MGTKLNKEQKGVLADMQAELYRVTSNGTRNFADVRTGLQGLIEGRRFSFSETNPCIPEVERQLRKWQELGVVVTDQQRENILQQADNFEPLTDSDVPLVTGGFGYADPGEVLYKLHRAFVSSGERVSGWFFTGDVRLRYASGMQPASGIRLVHYDPSTYADMAPKLAIEMARYDKVRLAGIEVMEYLVLNPGYMLDSDGKPSSGARFSGLVMETRFGPETFSLLRYTDGVSAWMTSFDSGRVSENSGSGWTSPVVRECENFGS